MIFVKAVFISAALSAWAVSFIWLFGKAITNAGKDNIAPLWLFASLFTLLVPIIGWILCIH